MKNNNIIIIVISLLLLSSCNNIASKPSEFGINGNVLSLTEIVYKIDPDAPHLYEDNIQHKSIIEFNKYMSVVERTDYKGGKKTEYFYDDLGKCTYDVTYSNDKPISKNVYTYNNKRQCLTDSTQIYSGGKWSTSFAGLNFKYDNNGNKVRRIIDKEKEDSSLNITYIYDDNNMLTKRIGGILNDSTLYKYNNFNHCIEEITYVSGGVFTANQSSYEYDNNNNWTDKTTFIVSHNLTDSKLEYSGQVTIRHITYFDK